jgi:hypothetical protein
VLYSVFEWLKRGWLGLACELSHALGSTQCYVNHAYSL